MNQRRGDPVSATSKGGWLDIAVWSVARIDDFLLALVLGGIASLVHPERRYFMQLKRLVETLQGKQGTVREGTASCIGLSPETRYVVLSDHHLLYQGSPHDYVGGTGLEPFDNERILYQMLQHYRNEDYHLIENGDVEDLVVTAPRVGLGALSMVLQGMGLVGRILFRSLEREERLFQLKRVQGTYRGLQQYIREAFHDSGRFIKLYGNHEEALRNPEALAQLREVYPNIEVHDYAVIQSAPAVVVCHGHHFDPWTNPMMAPWIGESITESFSWAGQGADRIWLRNSWIRDFKHRENTLVKAPSLAPSEPGQFTPKVRHMGEVHIVDKMNELFGPSLPWLILGHSHEPRMKKTLRAGRVERYVNCGSAGRYQDLVWCAEIVDGNPSLHAWYCEDGTLFRTRFVPRRNSLEPLQPQSLGPLQNLPWTRPTAEELDAGLSQPNWWKVTFRTLLRAGTLVAFIATIIGLLILLWFGLTP